MKCKFCNSEWNTEGEDNVCPFCGKTITETHGFTDAKEVLSFIYSEHGSRVFDNPSILASYFGDYAPHLFKERKLIKICLDSNVIIAIYSAIDLSIDEKKLVAEQSAHKLHKEFFVDELAAIDSINWIIGALDWGFELQKPKSTASLECEEFNVLTGAKENKQYTQSREDSDLHPDYLNHLLWGDKDYVFGISVENEVCSCGSGEEDYQPSIIEDVGKWRNIVSLHESLWILGYGAMVFGLRSNGTVAITRAKYKNDPRSSVTKWKDIKMLFAGHSHIVGVKKDGTVVACGENNFGQCNVSAWKNVVSAQAYHTSTVGVLANGDVIYTGDEHSLKTFHNIKKMDDYYKIGIKNDGTLAVADPFWSWKDNNPTDWLLSLTNVKELSCNYDAIAVLFYDGTVQCLFNKQGILETTSGWNDIIQVIIVSGAVVGLRNDGTLLAVDEKGMVSLSENVKDVIHMQFRVHHDILVLQNNGRVNNVSLYEDSEVSWIRSVRGWILFSTRSSDLSNLKKYRYNDGCCYIGDWYNGKRHGKGTYIDSSGEKMCGEFRNDRIYNGEGVVCYNDGKFIGSYIEGQKTGKGTRIWNDGTKYEGEYMGNKMNGSGIYIWPDGSSWEGEFKDDEPWNGKGTWHYQDGKTKIGKWKNGRKKLF